MVLFFILLTGNVFVQVIFNSQDTQTFLYNGNLHLCPGVDQLPHLGVPYSLTNGGQQLRHASGRCPELQPIRYINRTSLNRQLEILMDAFTVRLS